MIFCGTGHRPNKLGGYSDSVANVISSVAKSAIILSESTKIISGMALGWDQALAHEAILLNIPFIAAVPFRGQEKRWPSYAQEYYYKLLSKAERIEYISMTYTPSCMNERNKWMVDNSEGVLALYNGTPSGTRNCVEYARGLNKIVKNFWTMFSIMLAESPKHE